MLGQSATGGHSPLGTFTPTTPVAGASSARKVTGLSASSVSGTLLTAYAVGTDGNLYGWGVEGTGKITGATGPTVSGYVDTPTRVSGSTNVSMVAATQVVSGSDPDFVLRNDGTVWYRPGTVTWTSVNTTTVTAGLVAALTDVRRINAGPGATSDRVLAVKNDGTAWTVAYDVTTVAGSTGPIQTTTFTARQITGVTGVADIKCTLGHCLALKTDGTVVAWGYNSQGQLGNGTTTSASSVALPSGGATAAVTPVAVTGLSNVVAIAVTANGSVAVKSDGTVWSWGQGDQIGLGSSATAVTTPTRVTGLGGAAEVACASTGCAVRLSDGTLWGWGTNGNGELGDGTTSQRFTPVQATGINLN